MTLTEYLNQKDPIRNPNVIVQKSEVSISESILVYSDGHIQHRVYFKTDNPLLAGREYAIVTTQSRIDCKLSPLKGGLHYLRTVDEDGNVKGYSCFKVQL